MLLAFSFLSLLLPFVSYLGSAWANLAVTCDYQQGAGLEARSCFDAWNLAPRSPQQEKWLPNYSPPPHLPGTVISPKVVFSSKCISLSGIYVLGFQDHSPVVQMIRRVPYTHLWTAIRQWDAPVHSTSVKLLVPSY